MDVKQSSIIRSLFDIQIQIRTDFSGIRYLIRNSHSVANSISHTASLSMLIAHDCESSTGGQRSETQLCNHYCDGQWSAHDPPIQAHLNFFRP